VRIETVPLVEVDAMSRKYRKDQHCFAIFLKEEQSLNNSSEYQVFRYSNVNYFSLSTVKL